MYVYTFICIHSKMFYFFVNLQPNLQPLCFFKQSLFFKSIFIGGQITIPVFLRVINTMLPYFYK